MSMPKLRAYNLSLTARLAIGLSALLIVGGFVLSIAAFAYGRVAAQDAFDRLLVGAANTIASTISISDGALVVELPQSAFDLLALAPNDRIAYQVRGVNGSVITGYALADIPGSGDFGSQDVIFFDAHFSGEPARFVRTVRQFSERQLSGTVEVIVGQTMLARQELALDIARKALIGLFIGGVAILGITTLVVRSALRPLAEIATTVRGRDPQDLTHINQNAPKEIAAMVTSLNGFMTRLEQQFDVMRNLISDTAHQLRTPVAALRAQSNFALNEADDHKRIQIIEKIHDRSISLGRLLDQMLSRAMVIHRLESARRETIDLRDIALTLLDQVDHTALYPDQDILLDIGDVPILVRADTVSLEEAAKNLFSNALAHGKSPITVGADRLGAKGRLWIKDAGPGPTYDLQEAIGNRFLRSSASRGKSSGLGLSIAKSVADAFGGDLNLHWHKDGFQIDMMLPLIGAKDD